MSASEKLHRRVFFYEGDDHGCMVPTPVFAQLRALVEAVERQRYSEQFSTQFLIPPVGINRLYGALAALDAALGEGVKE